MSTPMKRTTKSKFLTEDIDDFIDESKYLKEPSKNKKATKRIQSESIDEDIPQSTRKYQEIAKKKKVNLNEDSCREVKEKILETMDNQINIRKQSTDNLLKSLTEVMEELKEDCITLKNNQLKLQQLATALVKCIGQATSAQEQKLKTLNDIHSAYKKQVEGLINRGGMKADDRPLWFDVYKAFPPITEPKFAKPKPEIKPIRQILYKEDELRVKFHSKGYGLGAINMMISSGESQTKHLLKQYEKQKALGVSDDEIIDKCAEITGNERKAKFEETKATSTTNSESVTTQVLKEANLKNIFDADK